MSEQQLAEAFVEMADTLVDDFDLIDFLHRLADSVSDVTGGSSAGLFSVRSAPSQVVRDAPTA